MPELLNDLEPKALWRYFLELSRIPRGSGNEAAAARWVAEQGRALGAEVDEDAVGNVLIRARATAGKEGRPPLALQAHVDMVCEKADGVAHDFLRDPIDVWRDGDLLRARGTTLGADNGVGVAAALAAISSPEVRHGPLEILVTVDEERGLTGANAIAPGWLRARALLNLDSEELGELTIGCAGGMDSTARRAIGRVAARPGSTAVRVKVHGLKGGHSGIDIARGRANAIRVLAQILDGVGGRLELQVASLSGGSKRNAIPREASAVVLLDARREPELRAELDRRMAEWRLSFGAVEPELRVSVEPAHAERAIAPDDAQALVRLLLSAPHGVEAMSPDIPGLVQTSTNLAQLETQEHEATVGFLTRSAIEPDKHALGARVAAACALAGFTVAHDNGYPGWKPDPSSALVKLVDATHREVFGAPMVISAIHAGLECGIIGEKYPGMEMASIGPTMRDVHTPDERLDIPAVGVFWRLLVAVLDRF